MLLPSVLCCAVLCCCYPSPFGLLLALFGLLLKQTKGQRSSKQQGAAVLFAQKGCCFESTAQHFSPLTAGESAQHFLLPPWNLNAAKQQGGASLLCCAVLCCAVLCCAVLCCAVLCCAVPKSSTAGSC